MNVAMRVSGDPDSYIDAIRRKLQPELPSGAYLTTERMSDVIGTQTRAWRAGTMVFTALGGLALLVAAIGLYGVIAYNVAQRTHELGVRIALGAQRRSVVSMVVADGVRFSIAGLIVGSAIALGAGRWIAPLLFQEQPRDPVVFGVVAMTLLVVTVTASAVPATRARCRQRERRWWIPRRRYRRIDGSRRGDGSERRCPWRIARGPLRNRAAQGPVVHRGQVHGRAVFY